MNALTTAAADYLAVRRALGYKLIDHDRQLASFVAYLDSHATATVTVTAALDWATSDQHRNRAQRLTIVRGFARYLQALDPVHEVPPTRLLPTRRTRPVPHLYSQADVTALMDAARKLEPPLRAATTETVIGLLAVTGMRIGEVLRLDVADIDWDAGVLTVWLSKFNKSRHVPLTASTVAALARYDQCRRQILPTATNPAMFVSRAGNRLTYPTFVAAFATLLDTTAISTSGQRPRIHGFRHSFAVTTVLGWYRQGADVQALLPRLSTYLGHADPASTYWYLSAAPELMAIAAQRLDQHRQAHR